MCWLLVSPYVTIAQDTYTLEDEPGSVFFTIRNFGIGVQGTFGGIMGKIWFGPQLIPDAHFDVSIPVKTVNTGIALRDKHLLKEDYFNAEGHASIRFISETIKAGDKKGIWLLGGKLTIKGVAKYVVIPFRVQTLPDSKLNFSGEFKINRRYFGVGSKSLSLGDEVMVTLSVVATRQLL